MKQRLTLFFLFFLFFISAQHNVHDCATHTHLKEALKNPDFLLQHDKDQAKLKSEEALRSQNLSNKSGGIYTIPVVFHVLHNGGSVNISDLQIKDALRVLNRDFRKQNPDAFTVVSDFQNLVADIEIEFAFATIAPNGACFNGITRTYSPLSNDTETDSYGGGDQVDAIVAGNNVYQGFWDPEKYLNIYVCGTIGGLAAGYTRYPSNIYNGNMTYNGIFMLSSYIGSIGTSSDVKSRVLTHEVGHWLNLPHVWGSTNEPGIQSNCSFDDGVSDTPNTIGNQTCALSLTTCGSLDNVENYMNYASFCRKMFTIGQRSRMRTAITSTIAGRNNLWQVSNLNEVGANETSALCVADFYADYNIICENQTVNFTDNSYPNPTAWNWSFPGGVASSLTSSNPSVSYDLPGMYHVTLTASNSGGTNTVTKNHYIKVLKESGIAPIREGFEFISTIPSDNWLVQNFHSGRTWEVDNGVGYTGSKSVVLKNSENLKGSVDELLSTTINLELNYSASISFKYAFAKKDVSNNDKLIVKVSKDCGETWVTKKTLGGNTIETAPKTLGNFVPTSTQWKTAEILSGGLSNYLVNDFRMKFVFEGDGGNNVYIDDINIDGPVSVKENSLFEEVNIYPNPTSDNVNLSFLSKENNSKFAIKVFDVIGKTLAVVYSGELSLGEHQYSIKTDQYESGVYFISLGSSSHEKLYKFVVN